VSIVALTKGILVEQCISDQLVQELLAKLRGELSCLDQALGTLPELADANDLTVHRGEHLTGLLDRDGGEIADAQTGGRNDLFLGATQDQEEREMGQAAHDSPGIIDAIVNEDLVT
jgi:hypothetical protein